MLIVQKGIRPFKVSNVSNVLLKRNFSSQFQIDPMISVKDAYELFKENKSVFIDVRDPLIYKRAHIQGAQNVNEIFTYLSTSDEKGKKELIAYFEKAFQRAGLTGNEHVITYDDCLKTGYMASCRGYFLLRLFGQNNVNVLNGGFEAWIKEKYPISSEISPVKEGTFKAKWSGEIFASKDDVLMAMNNHNIILLDVRENDEWQSVSTSPSRQDFFPKKGKIPGAVHLFWRDLLYTKNNLIFIKDPSEVDQICKQLGITKDKEVIIYCFKGSRASNTFLALHRAGYKVKNYFASWNEWSRNPSLPIVEGKQ